MWSFKKSSGGNSAGFQDLKTDIHSHLIAGIDDGAEDDETSIALIKGLMELGFQKIITTPHVLWNVYSNTAGDITKRCNDLNQTLLEAGVEVELSAAAEYYMDDHFFTELQKKVPLLSLKDNIVLVEYSMVTAPFDLKDILFEMEMQDYHPLIAHPERYIYLKDNKKFLEELKDAGYSFQLNLLSLAGAYGTSVQELAEFLIRNNYYSYAGTDLHNAAQLQLLKKVPSSSAYKRLIQSGKIKNHLL